MATYHRFEGIILCCTGTGTCTDHTPATGESTSKKSSKTHLHICMRAIRFDVGMIVLWYEFSIFPAVDYK